MRELGEFALIERMNAGRVQAGGVLLGPGDDAAVVAAPDGRFVVTTDMLVQDRHFRLDWSRPEDVGRKAIAQNAADVVAMGAAPTAFVVALGCPADTPLAVIDSLVEGMWAEAARAGASIAGGDLVRSRELVVSVTAFGDLRGRAPITRAGARVGDTVAVAGRLGWSAAGLHAFGIGRTTDDLSEILAAHRVPQPPYAAVLDSLPGGRGVSAGQQEASPHTGVANAAAAAVHGPGADSEEGPAAESRRTRESSSHRGIGPGESRLPEPSVGPHALTDVSDGLLADLGHLAAASGVAIDLDSAALRDPALEDYAARLEADAAQWILTGGEDHAFAGAWPPGRALPPGWVAVGRVAAGSGVTVDGVSHPGAGGWESFRGAESAPEGGSR